jgi:hypothetical protein
VKLSPDLKREVWGKMMKAGDRLKPVLQEDPGHPKGRNPYAHVAGCVRDKFGCSYGELPDEKATEVIFYLEELVKLEGGI